jgi:hypothetical protein
MPGEHVLRAGDLGRREWFGVDIRVCGEDITAIRLRGVKGREACPSLGFGGWVLGLLDNSRIEALLRPGRSALRYVQLLPDTALVGVRQYVRRPSCAIEFESFPQELLFIRMIINPVLNKSVNKPPAIMLYSPQ